MWTASSPRTVEGSSGGDAPRIGGGDHQYRKEFRGATTSSRNFRGGNQRSHRTRSPGFHTSRSARSILRCSGRNRRALSRNREIHPSRPTRSAIAVVGITGYSRSSARTLASNDVNEVEDRLTVVLRWLVRGQRPVDGGPADPSSRATCRRGTPSATGRRVNAHTCGVIPNALDNIDELYPRGIARGNVCVSVPVEQLAGA